MPIHRITSAASALIADGKRAGQTSRTLAERLKAELGVEVDQRSISRHVRRLTGKSPAMPAKKASPKVAKLKGRKSGPILSEVEALQREVVQLQALLDGDLPPRDRVAITGEMRGLFKAIRTATQQAEARTKSNDADLDFVIKRLEHFREMNGTSVPTDGVAETTSAASGE